MNSGDVVIAVRFQNREKMVLVPGHEVVDPGRIRALQKDVVIGTAGDVQPHQRLTKSC